MAVKYLESDEIVNRIPFKENFDLLKEKLSPEEFIEAFNSLNERINGSEIETSSWMPGADWRDGPFQSIYEKPARKNPQLAAKLFGLLVFHVFMEREEVWITGKFELNGEPIKGRTYFLPK
jgi:hypothetical protein